KRRRPSDPIGSIPEGYCIACARLARSISLHDKCDCWILNELNKTIGKINDCLKNYTFHLAIVRLRDSFIKDFCDFYIEFSKIPIKQQSIDNIKSNVQILLYFLLKQYLILYHPFLPAMTEELWQDLTNGKQGYLIHQLYPTIKKIEK
ncbi:unnamed protein product, partial [Rotaria sp. Silwood2]